MQQAQWTSRYCDKQRKQRASQYRLVGCTTGVFEQGPGATV
jgi:hypothetical protein